jgi:basic amino acid/polyamine antiporter, APA family
MQSSIWILFLSLRVIALCLSQTGSLFSADSWHNIAFAAGEVRNPERNVTRAMVIGVIIVIALYILANVAYLVTLPLDGIQHAPADRVGTATLQVIFPRIGATLMAVAIMISTFGTINALTLTGARVYYAMARQQLFLGFAGDLNQAAFPLLRWLCRDCGRPCWFCHVPMTPPAIRGVIFTVICSST